jgi:hypothetical protein
METIAAPDGPPAVAPRPAVETEVVIMPAPTIEPQLFELDGEHDYQPGQRIWVYRAEAWRPGVVLHCTTRAITIRYRPNAGSGTGVDTVTGRLLAVREEDDPCLDAGTIPTR